MLFWHKQDIYPDTLGPSGNNDSQGNDAHAVFRLACWSCSSGCFSQRAHIASSSRLRTTKSPSSKTVFSGTRRLLTLTRRENSSPLRLAQPRACSATNRDAFAHKQPESCKAKSCQQVMWHMACFSKISNHVLQARMPRSQASHLIVHYVAGSGSIG